MARRRGKKKGKKTRSCFCPGIQPQSSISSSSLAWHGDFVCRKDQELLPTPPPPATQSLGSKPSKVPGRVDFWTVLGISPKPTPLASHLWEESSDECHLMPAAVETQLQCCPSWEWDIFGRWSSHMLSGPWSIWRRNKKDVRSYTKQEDPYWRAALWCCGVAQTS